MKNNKKPFRLLTEEELANPQFVISPFGERYNVHDPVDMALLEVEKMQASEDEAEDVVNHPNHYTSHPSGVECIQITEHMGFCLGNALKYIWRADLKGKSIEDLRKAIFYLEREIDFRSKHH